MQSNTFFIHKLKEKFLAQKLIEFNANIPQSNLNIEDKTRSNIFTWRGQFSPQLIENLLLSYCPRDAHILDPFAGSGTVIYEAACFGLRACGCELNPAAWILTRTYQLINLPSAKRDRLIIYIAEKLQNYFPKSKIFENIEIDEISYNNFQKFINYLDKETDYFDKIILDAFVILLDLANNKLTTSHIHNTFYKLCQVIKNFPYSEAPLASLLCDARCLPVETDSIDFVVTSPPYINVFNYHQNYRRSAEALGWDLLKIAKSEIGSNRANRGNRFLTVIQYCLDMAFVLRELQRVCKYDARIIFVVGHESNVLGVPFYNAEIISELFTRANLFDLALRQKRTFKNKFGKNIREELLNLLNKKSCELSVKDIDKIARDIAHKVLSNGLAIVSEQNKPALMEAIEKVPDVGKSPIYSYETTTYYQKP
ncbi:MAG TPA: methyltransferase [Cyanobacteria bacterium UBA11372]|nr:methyltransferase [Cyanobacteria bacterium UBA11372]